MKIAHLHGFKCAGSTFSWVLQKIYGDKLLYVEGKNSNRRLALDTLNSNVDIDLYSAITSHTLEYPHQHYDDFFFVDFVRNPYERLISAYKFQKKVGQIPADTNYKQYLQEHVGTERENYMTRCLSPQTFTDQNIWPISKESVPISSKNLFVGSVDYFDESLVLLEILLKDKFSLDIDLSYPAPLNVSDKSAIANSYEIDEDIASKIINRDIILSLKVNYLILHSIVNIPDFSNKLKDFRDRCKSLRGIDTSNVKIKSPSEWVIL